MTASSLRPLAAERMHQTKNHGSAGSVNPLFSEQSKCRISKNAFYRSICRPSPWLSNRPPPATSCRMAGIQASGSDEVATEEDEEDEDFLPPRYEGTIYAQSTAVGMGGIAVLRVSGADALPSLARLSKPGAKPPTPRYATLRTLMDPKSGALIDKALVIYFPGPNSFTGEDIVEYHVHGGIAIVNSLLSALGSMPGLRMATRGEFTRRAYLNGRMDLLEAEALNDLIHAETSGQQRQAMMQMSGAHRKMYQAWRTSILQCLAHVNAFIDYGDSEGMEEEETLSPVRADAQVCVYECVCVCVSLSLSLCVCVCVCARARVRVWLRA
jgi:hypothetical protein